MKDLDLVQLFPHAHKLDGFSGHCPDGEGSAAPGVAVQLGEHYTVDIQGVIKGFGGVDRVLADHGVHYQQDLSRRNSGLDPG